MHDDLFVETFKRTPLQLFNLPQHFVIPLFQRPYVWREEEQWVPLWTDIKRVAELRMNEPHLDPRHFLGAVVLQAHEAQGNRLVTWNVIDGQQRLTTLQLLMDAAAAVMAEAGLARYASQLESLTHNSVNFLPDGESPFKLRHMNLDHAAFDEVMGAEPPVDHPSLRHSDSRIVEAHEFFSTAVAQWLGDSHEPAFGVRAEHLAQVLQGALQLVSIELTPNENSQEIFETLNARGTPLTAADLVRNFVFQRIAAEGGDAKKAYREDWPFETKFWGAEVSVGRYPVSRSSLFLNQWLIARMGEEIGPPSTFSRFKSFVENQPDLRITDLLPVLKAQADLYEAWTVASERRGGDLTAVEMSFYRMRASGIELLKPLLIWLFEPGRPVPPDVVDQVIGATESWVFRRQLLRLPGSDLGRIVADLIRLHSDAPVAELSLRVAGHLARLNVTSTYWPGDDEIRATLATEAAYRRFPRARLRMFLEAIENWYRGETSQPQVERKGYPIEHVLPQNWQRAWPVGTLEEELDRQAHVHRLGNLTLLTQGLNSKVSNGPWGRKRKHLLKHNTINLTGRLVEQTQDHVWDERLIDKRTAELTTALLSVWAVPEGHIGTVVDPQVKAQDWVEIKHLVEAGLLAIGDTLVATHRDFPDATATVTTDRGLEVQGRRFGTPSGAAWAYRKKATNGWYFWAKPDGRRLRDLRDAFLTSTPGSLGEVSTSVD